MEPKGCLAFERCIKRISRNYQTVLLKDLMQEGKIDWGKKYATLRFDDGNKVDIEFASQIEQ